MDEWVNIPVKPETREILKNLGKKGETYDEIIRKLIEFYRKEGGKIEWEKMNFPKSKK